MDNWLEDRIQHSKYMSPQYRLSIDMSNRIKKNVKILYETGECSDVTFLIRGERFLAHKFILGKKLNYIRDLFKSTTNKKEIELDVNPLAFKKILQYIYTGILDMREDTDETVGGITYLAKKFRCEDLYNKSTEILLFRFNRNNYGRIMNATRQCSKKHLYRYFLNYLDEYPSQIIQEKCFTLLNKEVVADIIKRGSFCCNELVIFKAVMKWSQTHTKEELKFIIPHIRFVLIDTIDLYSHVQPTGVLTNEEFAEVIYQKSRLKTYPHRVWPPKIWVKISEFFHDLF